MAAIHAFRSGSRKILCDITLSVAMKRKRRTAFATLWREVVTDGALPDDADKPASAI